MKINLSILFILFSMTVFSQTEEIYKLTFSDPTNFKLTTHLRHKQPKRIRIVDTTKQWYLARFWLEGQNLKSKENLKELENDEHHPYNHTYLFTDTALDSQIPDREKVELYKNAAELKSKKIDLKGDNYSTMKSADNVKGFYFITTQPVFSTDKNFAFIDLLVFYKDSLKQELNETYFGTICVVYKKQTNGKWSKIKLREHLIL